MMYSEFIKISNFPEQYISFAEYTTFIEPLYMAADQIPTKQDFITLLCDAFDLLVYPVVKKAFHNRKHFQWNPAQEHTREAGKSSAQSS